MSDLTDADLISTAHHEAAHAVVNYRTAGFVGGATSIVPNADKGTAGHASDLVSDSMSPAHMEARILSYYAGGHAQRRLDPRSGDAGCGQDDEDARALLFEFGWEGREQELREHARALVEQHWAEIVAVAVELCRVRVLDDTEVELIADAVLGDPDADLTQYRAAFGSHLAQLKGRIALVVDEKGGA